jgi:hypothetical protein
LITSSETVRAEGHNAFIELEGDRVRFIVPDRQYVRLSVRGIGVRGVGPFDLTFTPDRITGAVDGAIRTLVTTWPAKITRPMFRIDDRRWYAGWSDVAAISKSPEKPDWAIAFGVKRVRRRSRSASGSSRRRLGDHRWPAPVSNPLSLRQRFGGKTAPHRDSRSSSFLAFATRGRKSRAMRLALFLPLLVALSAQAIAAAPIFRAGAAADRHHAGEASR